MSKGRRPGSIGGAHIRRRDNAAGPHPRRDAAAERCPGRRAVHQAGDGEHEELPGSPREDGASRRRARRAGPRLDEPGPAPRAGLQQLLHHLPVLRRPRHPPRPGRPPALHLVASLVREEGSRAGAARRGNPAA